MGTFMFGGVQGDRERAGFGLDPLPCRKHLPAALHQPVLGQRPLHHHAVLQQAHPLPLWGQQQRKAAQRERGLEAGRRRLVLREAEAGGYPPPKRDGWLGHSTLVPARFSSKRLAKIRVTLGQGRWG